MLINSTSPRVPGGNRLSSYSIFVFRKNWIIFCSLLLNSFIKPPTALGIYFNIVMEFCLSCGSTSRREWTSSCFHLFDINTLHPHIIGYHSCFNILIADFVLVRIAIYFWHNTFSTNKFYATFKSNHWIHVYYLKWFIKLYICIVIYMYISVMW